RSYALPPLSLFHEIAPPVAEPAGPTGAAYRIGSAKSADDVTTRQSLLGQSSRERSGRTAPTVTSSNERRLCRHTHSTVGRHREPGARRGSYVELRARLRG